ncbi:MAG: ferritin-like domain-containing protein [Candidatus Bipolaricaulota bacterium]
MGISAESVQLAVDLEKEGYEYYREHAEKTDNSLTETVLNSLASRELEHIEVVNQIAEGKSVSSASLEKVDIEGQIKDVFQDFSAKEREGWKKEEEEVYEHGLELEQKLYDLYEDLKADAENPDQRDFFDALMKEENKHYESLQNVIYYLTDHDRWMAEEEGKVWGWMNV